MQQDARKPGKRSARKPNKHRRSKAKLRTEIVLVKDRNADLWDELRRLRGLAAALREWFDPKTRSDRKLYDASFAAGIFEVGPGVNAVRREKRSTDASQDSPDLSEPLRSKDPLTERYYQEDQVKLQEDGWTPFKNDEFEVG